MKARLRKFILTIEVLLLFCPYTNAQNFRPMWKDFCPKGLENAEYKEIQWFWPESTKATQSIYNYWAARREEFEKGLAECDTMQEDFNGICYDELKKRQIFVTEQYNKDIRQKQISNQIWRDIHDKGSSPIMINIFQR